MENGKLALKDGGILIFVASCPDGIGPGNFYELLKSAPTPKEVLDKIACGYKLGYHKAAKLSEIQTWAEIWAYTDMEPDMLEAISMSPLDDLQKGIDEALEKTGGKVIIMLNGSMNVPLVEQTQVCD